MGYSSHFSLLWKEENGLLTHSSTLHYPFTENGFQILATFIKLKMNLKIGQSHYF